MPKEIHIGRNLKVVLPPKLAKDVEAVAKEEGYTNLSEFGRYVFQDDILRKSYGLNKAPGGIGVLEEIQPHSAELADRLMKTYLKGRQGTSQLATYVHLENGLKKFA